MTPDILSEVRQPRLRLRVGGLWAGAAAIVFAGHVAVAYAVQNLSFETPDGGPPPALAIEMAPLVTAPPLPEETAMLDRVTPDRPDPVEEAETVTDQSADAAEAEHVEQAEPTVAALSDQPPLEEIVPEPIETVAPEAVVPLPKPVETEVKPTKPVEAKKKADKKLLEKPKERPKKEKAAKPPKAMMTASIDARAGAKAAALQSSDAAPRSSASPSRWNASLKAWIRRHTRYPSAAKSRKAEGSPNVTFTVDASGRVVSARLARSSGDADLDRAALAALQGASVPAPPAELGAPVTRTAPFVFSLRD